MSPNQIALLRELIIADRDYWVCKEAGELVHSNDRGIEVGFDWAKSTADSLVKAGLAESLDPGINGHAFIFLGTYNVYERMP